MATLSVSHDTQNTDRKSVLNTVLGELKSLVVPSPEQIKRISEEFSKNPPEIRLAAMPTSRNMLSVLGAMAEKLGCHNLDELWASSEGQTLRELFEKKPPNSPSELLGLLRSAGYELAKSLSQLCSEGGDELTIANTSRKLENIAQIIGAFLGDRYSMP